jgi:hypothetical protein
MDPRFLLKLLAGAACLLGGLHFWRAEARPSLGELASPSSSQDSRRGDDSMAAGAATSTRSASSRADGALVFDDLRANDGADGSADGASQANDAAGANDGAAGSPRDGRHDSIPFARLQPLPSSATRAPRVPEPLARAALRRVGGDPAAEATWLDAIHDPQLPPEARSDLIEDLNDEGYVDARKPGAADLPRIVARLELIERLAPRETDAVNLVAFREAYKDLLQMYVEARLRGARR